VAASKNIRLKERIFMGNNPLHLFKNPSFLRVWGLGFIGNTMRWLETLAIGIFVYEVTTSALLVALMTIARQLPLALFGSFIGPFAERFNRKQLLMLGSTVMTVSVSCLAVSAYFSFLEIWHIAILVFINGTCWTLDYPVRRTLVGEFSGPERMGAGISLDSATTNVTRMLGPFLGGVTYGFLGLEGAFIISAVSHFICICIACSLVFEFQPLNQKAESYFLLLKEGLIIVKKSPQLIGVYLVTIILNIFGFPYASMVPVLGRDVYKVEPALIGILSAAEGAGAFVGALVVAFFIRPSWFNKVYTIGALTFISGIFCLSLVDKYFLGISILWVAGLGMAGFGAMQSTLVLTLAPKNARSRLMGVLSVCIGCAPIGLLNLGLLADLFGAQIALTIVSSAGFATLLLTIIIIPQLRR
jgi:MFS family permease